MSDQEQHSGHSHATFISGILVGILIALLFTTKKGRKLLKIITDEGIGKFNQWEDILALLEEQISNNIADDEEPVIGEDLKEEVKEIESSKKASLDEDETKRVEKKEEKIDKDEVAEKKVEPKVEATIVEKIEEKVKEVEAIASELREVKEAIEEKVEESKEGQKTQDKEEVAEEPKFEEDLPLHKALDPIVEEEEPKKKSRRLFRGIRRK